MTADPVKGSVELVVELSKGLIAEAEALASKRHATIDELVAEVIPDSTARSLRRALAGPREGWPVSYVAPPAGASAEFVDSRPADERITIIVPAETAAALIRVHRRIKSRGRGRVSRSEGVASALLAHLLPNGAWLPSYIEEQQEELREARRVLAALKAGKRRKQRWQWPRGWPTLQEGAAAYVRGLRAWIAVLRAPDPSLAKFIARQDLQLSHYETQARALEGRRRTFLDRYAHPDWQEAERVRRRERRRGRREEERVNRTGEIDRDAIYRRDEGICFFCGKPVDVADFHVHHVRAIARDGAHGPENLRVAHPLCNAQDGARLRGARRMLEMDDR